MPKSMPLRPYQRRDLANLRAALGRHRRVCLTAPTGYGKTRIAAELAHETVSAGKRMLFLAPWRELITQSAERFAQAGLADVGVMMAGYPANAGASVVVGSVETVRRWRERYPELADVDRIVLDEAHRYSTDLRGDLVRSWPDAEIIGVTATPFKASHGGLGDLFDELVTGASMAELVDLGFLVPTRYWAGDPAELDFVRVLPTGDFSPAPFEDTPRADYVGDLVSDWQRYGKGTTLVFAAGVAHSRRLAEAFNRSGIVAEHLDAETPADERAAILARLATNETQVVCNCGVLTEGFDLPIVETVVLPPTQSLSHYLQMVGRGMRPAPGKTECRVLDPAGNVYRFGFPEDYREWSLDGAPQPQPLTGPSDRVETMRGEGGRREPIHAAGELEELTALPDDAAAVLARLEAQGEASGYGMPWVVAEYRRRFGEPPAGGRYRDESKEYLQRQAKAAGLPRYWVKERLGALFA